MLLVLWVIRLLNGADITPGGQGVGFDCVIEFSFFPPHLLPFLCRGAKRKSFLLRLVAQVEEQVFGSGPITRFSSSQVTMATPSRKRELQNVFMWLWICVCMHCCVCFGVFVPQSASILCCAVTYSQISQRIYHPVNCLWVVDKMAPIHSHMKTLRG